MKSVVVTGGSGKAGQAIIRELLAHGYAVMNVDLDRPPEPLCHFLRADLNDLGQAMDVLQMGAGMVIRARMPLADPFAVIHMAGIPSGAVAPDATVFQNNMMTTYNVFSAATRLGLSRVVWASSEMTYGPPLVRVPPRFLPLTEDHPLAPENGYALAKELCERTAVEMHRWNPATRFVGLRITNIFDQNDYRLIPGYWSDPAIRRWNVWSWVDSRDLAQACRLAIEADVPGADVFNIAAADTVMKTPSRELAESQFPGVAVSAEIGEFETLQSIAKARRVLGYTPQHTWR